MEQSTGKNFFVKYWNGEILLWKSFWLITLPVTYLLGKINRIENLFELTKYSQFMVL